MSNVFSYSFLTLAIISASLIGLVIPSTAGSSIDETAWNQGVVVLVDDEVLSGEIYYNPLHQLVLLRSGDGQPIATLTTRQVQRFFYYSPQDNIIHRFLTIERRLRSSYVVRSFYEVVTEGPVLYLRQSNHCTARPPRESSPHTVAFHYYAYYRGKLVRARAFEKDLLPTLLHESPALVDYMKSQRLHPYHVGDQILLVSYFNRHLAQPFADLTSRR